MGYNQVIGLGNLGSDAEVQDVGGNVLVKFSLACSETYLDSKTNEKKTRTEWMRCSAWGKRWGNLAPHLTKGKSILVTGTLRTDEYEKNGEKRFATGILVNNIEFAGNSGGKKDEGTEEEAPF